MIPPRTHFRGGFYNKQGRVFDNTFRTGEGFYDKNLPKRYAPFNVAVPHSKLLCRFRAARKATAAMRSAARPRYIDVFTTKGKLLKRLLANGPLNAPWGMAIAPANFGSFAGDLLVGNFGDGRINAFDWKSEICSARFTVRSTRRSRSTVCGRSRYRKRLHHVLGRSGEEAHGLVGLITPK